MRSSLFCVLLPLALLGCSSTSTPCGDCDGCCDASGACHPGTTPEACGAVGDACQACTTQQFCVRRTCVAATTGHDDAGTEPADAGDTTHDAGSETPDAGDAAHDAGAETPDAGDAAPDAGAETPDAGSGGWPDGGALSPYWDGGTCAVKEDCPCFSSDDCGPGFTCHSEDDTGYEVWCVPGQRGTGLAGDPCTGEADCLSALCTDSVDVGVMRCSSLCGDDADCPPSQPRCTYIGFGIDRSICAP